MTEQERKPRRLWKYTNDILIFTVTLSYISFTYLGITDMVLQLAFLACVGFAIGKNLADRLNS